MYTLLVLLSMLIKREGKRTMKLIIAILTFMFIFQSSLNINKAEIIPVNLFNLVHNEHFQLDEWRVYQREKIGQVDDFRGLQKVANRIGKTANITEWKFERMEDHHYKATGTTKLNKIGIKTTVILFGLYEKGNYHVMISQIATGKDENAYNKLQLEQFNKTKTPDIFYTLTASKEKELPFPKLENTINSIVNNISAKKSEKLEEKNFLSISVYTPLIKDNLPLEHGKKMNLQVAMRNLENKTTLTIGTPIIITEY